MLLQSIKNNIELLTRDALVGYTLEYNIKETSELSEIIKDENALYQHLLLDVSVSSEVMTTPLREAISSVQLYVNQAINGVEPSIFPDVSSLQEGEDNKEALKKYWTIASHYRTWEANEKLAMCPSIYMEPELRINKSKSFKTFEDNLATVHLSEEAVREAVNGYLSDMNKLSSLDIQAAYYEHSQKTGSILLSHNDEKTEHVNYYLRQFIGDQEQGITWGGWEEINLSSSIEPYGVKLIRLSGENVILWFDKGQKYAVSANVYAYDVWVKRAVQDTNGHWGKSLNILKWLSGIPESGIEALMDKLDKNSSIIPTASMRANKKVESLYIFGNEDGKNSRKGVIVQTPYDEIDIITSRSGYSYYHNERLIDMSNDWAKRPTINEIFCVTDKPELGLDGISVLCGPGGPVCSGYIRDSDFLIFQTFASGNSLGRPYCRNMLTPTTELFENEPDQCIGDTEVRREFGMLIKNAETTYILRSSIDSEVSASHYTFDLELFHDGNINCHINYLGLEFLTNLKDFFLFGVWNDLEVRINMQTGILTVYNHTLDKEKQLLIPSADSWKNEPIHSLYISTVNTPNLYISGFKNRVLRHGNCPDLKLNEPRERIRLLKERNHSFLVYEEGDKNRYLRANTSAVRDLSLAASVGMDTLFSYTSQCTPEYSFSTYKPNSATVAEPWPNDMIEFDGAMGEYFWDLFYYIPVLLAKKYCQSGQFEQAEYWLSKIFDPTKHLSEGVGNEYYWNCRPLREVALESLSFDFEDPDAIARQDPRHYQQAVFRYYIEEIIARGDAEYRKFTKESLSSAKMCYASAKSLLGERPEITALDDWENPTLGSVNKALLLTLRDGVRIVGTRVTISNRTNIEFSVYNYDPTLENFLPVIGGDATESTCFGLFTVGGLGQFAATNSAGEGGILHELSLPAGNWKIIFEDEHIGSSDSAYRSYITVINLDSNGEYLPRTVTTGKLAGSANGINTVGYTYVGSNQVPWGQGEHYAHCQLADVIMDSTNIHSLEYQNFWTVPIDEGTGTIIANTGPGGRMTAVGAVEADWQLSPREKVINSDFKTPLFSEILLWWDTIEARLYNLRHNLTIDGKSASLLMWQPKLDPKRFLQDEWKQSGQGGRQPLFTEAIPHQRFQVILEKARNYANVLCEFGRTLQGSVERQEGEQLILQQQQNMSVLLTLTQDIQQTQIELEQKSLEALQVSRDAASQRAAYYDRLQQQNISGAEHRSLSLDSTSQGLMLSSSVSMGIGAGLDIAPNIFGLADGGMVYGGVARAVGFGLQAGSSGAQLSANIVRTQEQYRRRHEEWQFMQEQAEIDLKNIDAQIEGSTLKIQQAKQQQEHQALQLTQGQGIERLLKQKFSGIKLYEWIQGRITSLYYRAYDSTKSLCLQAQAACQYELCDFDLSFIQTDLAFNIPEKGLLAGEALLSDLLRMELAYIQRNERRQEIVKTISLESIDSTSLQTLKAAGKCVFNFPNALFSAGYPNHYQRQIKTVRLSIPAVLGPYQDLEATLTQTSNTLYADEGELKPILNLRAYQKVAVSHGLNDSGLFQLDFNDPRYLPFEGTGVDSHWELDFPGISGLAPENWTEEQRTLMDSISDVIVQVCYTAKS